MVLCLISPSQLEHLCNSYPEWSLGHGRSVSWPLHSSDSNPPGFSCGNIWKVRCMLLQSTAVSACLFIQNTPGMFEQERQLLWCAQCCVEMSSQHFEYFLLHNCCHLLSRMFTREMNTLYDKNCFIQTSGLSSKTKDLWTCVYVNLCNYYFWV
jgi:hypothetical protein